MPKESGRKVVATNRKARHDYHILDTYEAGIALMGTEVKSLREGHASMVDGFCTFYNDELWMEGIHIPEYHQGSWTNHAARRRRKLLLHRDELTKISHKIRESGFTIVPLQLYFLDGRA
ncbi:MAG: smpB, partial [Arthrobacter sp.]|nr:smpB [Arthrobacter sp.]